MQKKSDPQARPIIYSLNSDESDQSNVDLNPLPKSKASRPASISIDESIEIEIEPIKKQTRSLEVSQVISVGQHEEQEKVKQKSVQDLREVLAELSEKPVRQQQNCKERETPSKSMIVNPDKPIQVQRPYSQIKPAEGLDNSLSASTEKLPNETQSKTVKDILWSGIIATAIGAAFLYFTKSKRAGAVSAGLAFFASYDTFRKTL